MSNHTELATNLSADAANDVHQDPYGKIRADIVHRGIPWSLAVVGAAIVVVSVLNSLLSPSQLDPSHVAQFLLGLVFMVMALVTRRRRFGATTLMWLWALMVFLAVALTAEDAISTDNIAPLGYALIFMVAFGPVAMDGRPTLTSMAGQLTVFIYATVKVSQTPAQGVLAGVTAALAGLGLLKLRMSSVAAIAERWQATQRMTSTDPLTGLPNRQGLLDMLRPFVAQSAEQQLRLTVTLVDVRNLSELNAAHGTGYGDEVMRATAHALSSTVRRCFLLARWPGARFVTVDAGEAPDDDALQRRLTKALAADPATHGRTAPIIAVATATGEADLEQFDALYSSASQQMETPNFTNTTIVR